MTQQSHSWAQTQRKPLISKDTGTSMFIAALFTIARTWETIYHSSVDEHLKM